MRLYREIASDAKFLPKLTPRPNLIRRVNARKRLANTVQREK